MNRYNQVLLLSNNWLGGLDEVQCPVVLCCVVFSVDLKGPGGCNSKRKLTSTSKGLQLVNLVLVKKKKGVWERYVSLWKIYVPTTDTQDTGRCKISAVIQNALTKEHGG